MVVATDEIHGRIAEMLDDCLGIDAEEATLGASLQCDLGAESVDYLDIVFRLEKMFGIRIPRGELFENGHESLIPYVDDVGKINSDGIKFIRARYGGLLDLRRLEGNPTVDEFDRGFTVKTLVKYVQGKLNESDGSTN